MPVKLVLGKNVLDQRKKPWPKPRGQENSQKAGGLVCFEHKMQWRWGIVLANEIK